MGLLSVYYKSDSHEHSFISATIAGIEIHLSQTFLINAFGLMESLISAGAPKATVRTESGSPIFEGSLWLFVTSTCLLGKVLSGY